MGGFGAGPGNGESGNLSELQSRFEHVWLELKKLLPRYLTEKTSQASTAKSVLGSPIQLGKKYAIVGSKRVSLDRLRKVLGLESIRDAEGNMIQEAPLPVLGQLTAESLGHCHSEINRKTDLRISLEELRDGRSTGRITTLTFDIKCKNSTTGNNGDY